MYLFAEIFIKKSWLMALANLKTTYCIGKSLLLMMALSLAAGCSTLAKRNDTGVIVARRAQIRSSTAHFALFANNGRVLLLEGTTPNPFNLLEVNRGDAVDILDFQDVQDPTDNSKKERWLRVQAHDEDATEGWIESRNVMPDDVLQAAKKLADEDKSVPAQATGQLRASSNLRLSPDRGGNENIMMRLDSGSSFEIIGS